MGGMDWTRSEERGWLPWEEQPSPSRPTLVDGLFLPSSLLLLGMAEHKERKETEEARPFPGCTAAYERRWSSGPMAGLWRMDLGAA
jgi:hypothetical protein